MNKIRYIVRRGAKAGGFRVVRSEKDRRSNRIWIGDRAALDAMVWRDDPKEGDGRLSPRIRGTRIDVERTLLRVMEYIGRPCTIEEIEAAFGQLRAKRSDPLPADLGRILIAEEKRQRRAQKRLAAATAA